MRRVLGIAVAVGALLALTIAGTSANGVSGPAFYANGEQYRTVGTPTDFSNTGAPDHSFDIIYNFGNYQMNVAEAAPGDQDYNGGRWMVYEVSFTESYEAALEEYDANGNGVFDSDDEVDAAIEGGAIMTSDSGIRFECPAIPVPKGPKN